MEALMYDSPTFQDSSDSECLSSPTSSPHHALPFEDWSPETLSEGGSWMWDEASTDSASYSSSSSVVVGPSAPASHSSTPNTPSSFDHAAFVLAAAKGQITSIPTSVMQSVQFVDLDMSQISTQLVVRRRELEPSSPFFHSIRTRTASIVSASFVGCAEQVMAMARRIPKLFFSEASFMDACENAQTAVDNVMLCATMRRATKWATFSYAHDATMFPEPVIFQNPSNPAVFMVTFEFLLTAVDTTIRNLDGQRELMIDLDVLVPRQGQEAQTAFAEFFVRVDIQPGASGRHRIPGQRRRVYKRAPATLPAPAQRKVQTSRPLDEGSVSRDSNLVLRLRLASSHASHQASFVSNPEEDVASLAMLAKMEEMMTLNNIGAPIPTAATSLSYHAASLLPSSCAAEVATATAPRYVSLPPPPTHAAATHSSFMPHHAFSAYGGAFPETNAALLHSASPGPAANAVAGFGLNYPSQPSYSGGYHSGFYHPHLMPHNSAGPCYYGFHC